MVRSIFIAAGITLLLACEVREVRAQARTGQTNGLFGARSMGGSTSSLGSSSRMGGSGQGRVGQGGQGGLGTGGALGATSGGQSAGTLAGNERFVRGNRQAGSFVGADQRDVGRFVGEAQAGGAGNGLNSGLNRAGSDLRSGLTNTRSADRNGQRAYGNQGQGRQVERRVRAQRQVAFDYTPPAPRQVSTLLSDRLTKIPGIHSLGPLTVTVEGRTAILRGAVASDRDRVLAEQLALLEVGISLVQNELTTPEAAPPPPPPEQQAPTEDPAD